MDKQSDSVREHAIDYIDDLLARSPHGGIDIEACDLHHLIFNEDYFMVGTWNAKQWLGDQAFEAIEKIKDYEQDNFGQVTTDFSDAEKVANMLAYILGEEVLNESKTLQDSWNETLDRNALDSIRCELAKDGEDGEQDEFIDTGAIWIDKTHGVMVKPRGKGYVMTFETGSDELLFSSLKEARREFKKQIAVRERRVGGNAS